jgi:hypothetical protein
VSRLIVRDRLLTPYRFASEHEFEGVVLRLADEIFGPDTLLIGAKMVVGHAESGIRAVPDGYLIDLSRPTAPRLCVVEVELARHDPLRHIAVQLLRFAAAHRGGSLALKQRIRDVVARDERLSARMERLVARGAYLNADHLLEDLAIKRPIGSVVVIDEATTGLRHVTCHVAPAPEIVELRAFVPRAEPRLEEAAFHIESPWAVAAPSPPCALAPDTIVVPSEGAGLEHVFLGEQRWYAVAIPAPRRASIRFAAACRPGSPQAVVTHLATVAQIRPYRETGKWELTFAEPAVALRPAVPLPASAGTASLPAFVSRAELLDPA